MNEVTVDHIENAEEEFERLLAAFEETPTPTPEVTTSSVATPERPDTTSTPPAEVARVANDLMAALTSSAPKFTYSGPHITPNKIEEVFDDTHSRFQGAPWFELMTEQSVTVIGCGGIGSWASLLLTRLGIQSIEIIDDDVVESANMAGQLFGTGDIGTPKVNAVYSTIQRLCGCDTTIAARRQRYVDGPLNPITVGALDNMEARKAIYHNWKRQHGTVRSALFIDGRLSADELQVFTIQGGDTASMAEYEKTWLFDQKDGEETRCSFKQTSYMAAIIGGLISNMLVNHIANLVNPDAMFDLPFFTSYNSEMMWFKTK